MTIMPFCSNYAVLATDYGQNDKLSISIDRINKYVNKMTKLDWNTWFYSFDAFSLTFWHLFWSSTWQLSERSTSGWADWFCSGSWAFSDHEALFLVRFSGNSLNSYIIGFSTVVSASENLFFDSSRRRFQSIFPFSSACSICHTHSQYVMVQTVSLKGSLIG